MHSLDSQLLPPIGVTQLSIRLPLARISYQNLIYFYDHILIYKFQSRRLMGTRSAFKTYVDGEGSKKT